MDLLKRVIFGVIVVVVLCIGYTCAKYMGTGAPDSEEKMTKSVVHMLQKGEVDEPSLISVRTLAAFGCANNFKRDEYDAQLARIRTGIDGCRKIAKLDKAKLASAETSASKVPMGCSDGVDNFTMNLKLDSVPPVYVSAVGMKGAAQKSNKGTAWAIMSLSCSDPCKQQESIVKRNLEHVEVAVSMQGAVRSGMLRVLSQDDMKLPPSKYRYAMTLLPNDQYQVTATATDPELYGDTWSLIGSAGRQQRQTTHDIDGCKK